MRWCCALLLILILPLSAADLATDLDAALGEAAGRAAVVVADCADGSIRYRRNGDAVMALASTTKLLVAAAALNELGEAHELSTRVVGLGPVVGGAVPGLGVIGGGDPCLDEHFTERQPDRVFQRWAEELRRQGVRRIDGDVVVDAGLFSGPSRPATYPADAGNLQRWYSAPASAFAWNDNCIEVRARPHRGGGPAVVEVRPRSARIRVVNRTGGVGTLAIARAADSNTVTVSGSVNATSVWFPLAIHSDPDLLAADHLVALLGDAGIAVSGRARLGRVDANAGPLLIDQRSRLVDAVWLMNARSQNFYGEQLLRLVAVNRGGSGSISAGVDAVTASVRRQLGAAADAFTVLDGSGLSHGNTGSADALVALLLAQDRAATGAAFRASLKRRDVGDVTGMVKTGTLAVATCLAGYVEHPRGRRLAFAILLSHNGGGWAPRVRDRAYAAIAAAAR